eukprot:TRINITY_DN12467_c0_g1_i1.p1 TRINITY_DN12467_c0_g1~~TRINITY_DN12467_c0_g1_i1.p1  ORF type:complete len:218 (-),score=55.07 TRINITY_DN12467_c0_g1_i1:337-990(-)
MPSESEAPDVDEEQEATLEGEEEEAPSCGDALKAVLLKKHGSVVAAWKALDPLDHGHVSYQDFCRASRSFGYLCEPNPLWKDLDFNKDGFLTLDELDRDVALLLHGFATAVIGSCKSADKAWLQHFGARQGRCHEKQFLKAAKKVGFTGDAKAVYAALNADGGSFGVLHKDFRLLDKWFKPIKAENEWHFENLKPVQRSSCEAHDLALLPLKGKLAK